MLVELMIRRHLETEIFSASMIEFGAGVERSRHESWLLYCCRFSMLLNESIIGYEVTQESR
jgi:hypothetical protein